MRFKRIIAMFLMCAMVLSIIPPNRANAIIEDLSIDSVIDSYKKGVYNDDTLVQFRKELVENNKLEEYVDEEYFFKENHLYDLQEKELGKLIALVKISKENLADEYLIDGSSVDVKTGLTVTNHGNLVVYEGGMLVGRSDAFTVNGRVAFCGDHSMTSVPNNTRITSTSVTSNSDVRKVLYYGFGGPAKISGWDSNTLRVATAMAISEARNGDGMNLGRRLLNQVRGLSEPPSGFKAYIGDTGVGHYQKILYWEYAPKGNLQIEKSSSNPEITNGNNYYSLAGAVYGVYSDSNVTNQVATLTTGEDGKSQVIELDEATYYIKEINPPKGYALDNIIYPITVTSGTLALGKYVDRPQNDPVGVIIKKVDANTGEAVAQGGASLENAHFTFKFYEGEYSENLDPSTIGVKANRTWIMKTDKDGYTDLSDAYKVSGDEFYYTASGDTTLPLGTVTIQETKAPIGYLVNPEMFVRRITPNGVGEYVNTYNVPIIGEDVIEGRVKVTKLDEETKEKLQGAEFELIEKASDKVVETLITGANGDAISGLHPYGEYLLRESKAPNKYTLNGKEYPVTISEHMETIEITHSNRIIKGKVEIKKSDIEIKDLLLEGAEFTIYNEAGSAVEKLVTDNKGYAISGLLNYGNYTMKETKSPTGFMPNEIIYKIEIKEDGKVYHYDIENQIIKGKIQVIKLDENTNMPIQGVKFGVYAKNVLGIEANTLIEEIITDENGFAYTRDLRFGEYYLKELEAPDNYYISDVEYPVNIKENNKVYVEYISNKPVQGKLRVLKTDGETKTPIKNTKFKIVNRITGEDVVFTKFLGIIPIKFTEFKTDVNGEFIIPQNLEHGSYELVEVSPAEGYNPIDPIPFEINRDTNFEDIELLGKIHTIEVENTKIKGNVELLKYDTDSKEAIPGVTFKFECISGFDKGKSWEVVSNENGLVKLDNINYGKYKATEIKTVEGYVLNKKPIPFEIKNNGETIKLEMSNNRIKGDVDLLKLDADSKQPMKNVEFLVECLDGFDKDRTWTLFTGKDGIINLDKFNYGKYIIKEVKTLDGYILNTKPIPFEITEDGQKIELEMENERIKSDFTLLKVDEETGEPLSNALFKITCTEGFDKGKTWELYSDDYGLVRLNDANWGKYEVTEIKTPNDGYVLNTEVIKFDVKEHEEQIKFEFTNRKVKSNMELLKIDADTKKPMPFVTFKVTCVEGFEPDQEYILETDNEGIIKLDNLIAGIYRIDEVETREGYILNIEPMFFTVQNDGETIELEMENTVKKGIVILEKLDEDTKKPLEGVTFELCRGDQVIGTYTTDKDGRIEVKDLPWGNYYFVEIETIETHILDQDNFYDFFIEEDKQVIEITALNKIKEGELDFSKTDVSTGELIDGAIIRIEGLDEWNKHIDIEFTSSKDGNRFKLPVGKYKFTEHLAPIGYEISTEVGYFEIAEGGVTKAELKNKKIVKEELPYTGGTPAAATIMFGLLMTLGGLGLTKKRTNK